MEKLKSCSFYFVKNFLVRKYFIFLFISVVFIANGFFVSTAQADATYVLDEVLEENTHWIIDESPYLIIQSLYIDEGVTLTIDPGVIVKFDDGADLTVFGSLKAEGVEDNPIYFTSGKDDSLGGDTNLDENDTTPNKYDWGRIIITPETDDPNIDSSTQESSTLNYVISRYSGGGLLVFDKNVSSEGLNMAEEVLLFNSNSTFDKLSTTMFNLWEGSTATVSNSKINCTEEYSNGVSLSDASKLDITNTSINVNTPDGGRGILVFNGSSLSLYNVQIDTSKESSGDGVMIFDEGTTLSMKGSSVISNDDALYIDDDTKAVVDSSTFECSGTFCVMGFNSSILMTNSKVSGATMYGVLYDSEPITKQECTDNYDENGELYQVCADVILPPTVLLELNNNEIFNNNVGIFLIDGKIIGKKNNIHDNVIGVLNNNYHEDEAICDEEGICEENPESKSNDSMDLRNNYWGDKTGPKNLMTNPDGLGNEISDNVLYSPFLKIDPLIPTKNPVIIIPGVMGTEMFNGDEKLWLDLMHNISDIGDQFMDDLQFKSDLTPLVDGLTVGDIVRKPIILFDYSEGLINEFKNQGYVEGTDLFVFPYDWRYGVGDINIQKLKQKISDILTQTGKDKIDVIAHSTGGLLVKKYVIDNPTENHIDKAVFVGVPNTGAPQAIKTFLEGSNFGNPFLANSEIKKIAVNMPVIYDLSPSQQYFNVKGSVVEIIDKYLLHSDRKDLDFSQTNNFLIKEHDLNSQALQNANTLHTLDFDNYDLRTNGIDTYNIVGCKAGTISKVIERRTHGLLGTSITYDELGGAPGDGTVPLESATNLPVDQGNEYFALKASHSKMLSQNGIRQQIVNIISASNLSTNNIITQDISQCKLNGKAIAVYSPLSIDVVDQDGNHSGLSTDGVSIENNIPNASYEIMGDHKFIYLPDDGGQTYNISIKGTGEGVFTITDSKIVNNQTVSMQVFKDISVTPELTGTVDLGETAKLIIDGNNQEISPTYVLDENHIQDFDPTHEDEIISNHSSSGSSVFKPEISTVSITEKQNPEELLNTQIIKINNSTKKTMISKINTTSSAKQEKNISQNNTTLKSSYPSKVDNKIIIVALIFGAFCLWLVKIITKM